MNKHAANEQICTYVLRERIQTEYGIPTQLFPKLLWRQIEQQHAT
jgi:hypothetical protein